MFPIHLRKEKECVRKAMVTDYGRNLKRNERSQLGNERISAGESGNRAVWAEMGIEDLVAGQFLCECVEFWK